MQRGKDNNDSGKERYKSNGEKRTGNTSKFNGSAPNSQQSKEGIH